MYFIHAYLLAYLIPFYLLLYLQLGEDEWSRLSEAERQRRLVELRRQESRLRQQGQHDEAAELLMRHLRDNETLRQLMGDESAEIERRMRERLARRQQRMQAGQL